MALPVSSARRRQTHHHHHHHQLAELAARGRSDSL